MYGFYGGDMIYLYVLLFRRTKRTAHNQHLHSMQPDTYAPKNVLITGGAGFIASHVAVLFARKYQQYKVRSFILILSCSHFNTFT